MFKRLQFWVKISKLLAAGGGAKTPLALPSYASDKTSLFFFHVASVLNFFK